MFYKRYTQELETLFTIIDVLLCQLFIYQVIKSLIFLVLHNTKIIEKNSQVTFIICSLLIGTKLWKHRYIIKYKKKKVIKKNILLYIFIYKM